MTRTELRDVSFRPPVLETERLLLRGYEPEDEEAIYSYGSDPQVTPYMAWDRHLSIEDTRTFLHDVVAANYRKRQLDYALCLRHAPERPIGGMGLYVRSEQHQTAELGYVLSASHWGKGLVPEAAKKLIHHAFCTTKLERIYAPIFGDNLKSRRAAEKMGMQLDGVMRSALLFRGIRHDEAIYSVLRTDWLASGEGSGS